MNELVFASANKNKVLEVEAKLGAGMKLRGLSDIGCTEEIPETMPTIEGNAQQKARYVWEKYHVNCFADDTGLEVPALNNEPGVYSARYAGEQRSSKDNMSKLLLNLEKVSDRSARFRTVVCLILDGEEFLFEGIAAGHISDKLLGDEGFGYDPIFIPNGETRSFAQMTLEEKNRQSHRGKAIKLLAEFLKTKV
jgi:XTP/dITP diphosphohydrolase